MKYCIECEAPEHRFSDCPFLQDEIEVIEAEERIVEALARHSQEERRKSHKLETDGSNPSV